MSDSESRRGRFTPLKRLTDDELAAKAAGGDDKAFGALFERLQDPLYRYSLSILGNPEEARDALQNAILKAYRALRGETREIAARPWLYRIVRNEAVSMLRGRKPLGDLDEAVGVAAAGADVDAVARERMSELVADLRSLPERQRSALVLRELSGLDYDELGAALDISPNAARQTVFKARVSLQANVEGRTAHCDEVRAAMSKSDGRFRRRRSIQAHLERCTVCTEFADGLERRPRELAALFPPLPASAAAAMLAAVTEEAGAAAAGAGAAGEGAGGAAASAGAAGEESTGAAAAVTESPRDDGRRGRRVLVPLLLFLLLLGGTVAMALVADNAGEDDSTDTPAEVAQDPAGGDGTAEAERPGATDTDDSTAGSDREAGSAERGDDGRSSGEGSDDPGSRDSRSGSDNGRTERNEQESRSREEGSRVECVERQVRRSSPAQEGYSGRGGRVEVAIVEDCERVRTARECVGESGSDGGSGNGGSEGSGAGGGSGDGGDEGSGSGSGGGSGSGSGGSGGSDEGSSGDGGSGNGGDEGSGSASGGGSGSGSGQGSGCERVGADGLPITGLQLGLLGGTALMLLGLGFGLRRIASV